nr:GDSL-type esterase/lipase family protein [uncultured Acetatifactor sp.]
MIFEDMDRIVFAGDSVTDMGSAQPVGEGLFENLGMGYVRIIDNLLAACYPERKIRVTNSGVSGNTSRDLLARFQSDVVDLKPDWVSICIGINDVWRQYEDYCKIRHSAFIAWDRVHPNRVGATLMARAFLEKCEFDYNHGNGEVH